MLVYKYEGHLPIMLWAEKVDANAFDQAKNVASLPFAFHHVALMPDCHLGYGVPIGCVFPTKEVIVPNAIGLDIGCGVVAYDTKLPTGLDEDSLKAILSCVRSKVPVGFKHHKTPCSEANMPARDTLPPIVEREYQRARNQLGTLGGGNHFWELQAGDGTIWVMIHSGSRNLGKQVADHYNKLAVDLNAKWYSSVDKSKQLAFLPLDTQEAQDYILEMQYCVNFAFANRLKMMSATLEVLSDFFPDHDFPSASEIINIAHNYAALENHYGQNVWVHRKGATRAREGELGLIPGSQGTNSYVVKGLGNPKSFQSCSHGAGRKMGRKAAQRDLDLDEQKEVLQGVVHSLRSKKDLDEAPGAYKNIENVMREQSDLVEPVVELKPLAVMKG